LKPQTRAELLVTRKTAGKSDKSQRQRWARAGCL